MPEEADLILGIPLSINPSQDDLVWHLGLRGEFSVCSAHKLALKQMQPAVPCSSKGPLSIWKKIWQLKIPNKIKLFCWRACKGFLPTAAILFRRHICQSSLCSLCGDGVESIDHSLFFCDSTSDFWGSCPFISFLRKLSLTNFFDRFEYMCSVLNADITLRFIVTMWLVWRSRNVLSHGGKCSMGEDLWVVAGDFLSSFQMDSMHLDNNMESIEDESDEQSLSSYSADIDEILGDQQVLPRVGHQYQAEIPPCAMEDDHLQLINESNESEILVILPSCFALGLPIPLMWANSEVENINGTVDFENSEQSQIRSNDEHAEAKVQSLDTVLDYGRDVVGYLNLQSTTGSDQMDVAFVLPQESKTKLDRVERGLYPLPGSLGEPWKEIEQEIFLLGLYIFGKNLSLVKRFVESKGMGDVLSFYYGKFYKSDAYRRWSECRTLKSRRFIHGQKIFTGWRQQELLSRFFSQVSEECKNTLLEVDYCFLAQLALSSVGNNFVLKRWKNRTSGRAKNSFTINLMWRKFTPCASVCCSTAALWQLPVSIFRLWLLKHIFAESRETNMNRVKTIVNCSNGKGKAKNTDSRKFGEGKMSFEEYVFTLKSTVGVSRFIEAVAIGKGKQDLTGTAMEPVKTNHMVSVHPEIPVGKACSSLTSADIIRFLTGDFRLSKARSSDLFWEAVWPRLLARGWHSEQPKDQGIFGSKNSLVFLIPGVKKFSRRRLVKGDHYFDSVSDVLNKVASDPGLLEIELEAAKASEHKEEHKLDQSMKQNSDGLSNKRQHYLQPRKSSYNRHLMQFTIVDTSLFQGAGRPKVRELRSLPVETASVSTPSSLSSESDQDTSEDSEDEIEETNTANLSDHVTDRGAFADSSHCAYGILNNIMPNTHISTIVAVENHENHSMSPLSDAQQVNTTNHQFYQKESSDHLKSSATEQQNLCACNHGESSCSIGNISEDRKPDESVSHFRSNSNDMCDMVIHLGPPQNLSPASSLAKGRSDRSDDCNVIENCLDREVSLKNHEHPTLIDLNVPQVSSDFGNDEPFVTGIVQKNDNSCENKSSILSESNHQVERVKLADSRTTIDQQPIMNNRRQSTRNRPLTTKALEAFAYGYLSPKRKRKDAETPQNNSMSKASRGVRGRVVDSDTFNNGIQNNIAESGIESLDELCGTGNTSVVGES
ncbi:hypothetical protein JRO89_XS01G0376300 [Xanthoceras sorbifolium]|uniref:SANT domain-containing protein n=1 Tax=Xanthoceras sorbifolium TaxID=99658 RepID=A0ABQ8IPF7_9ROSI|nr:hypothetical protein JRO89_XS01G0376300 [Xanthoceras sorbifolium]